MRIDAFQPRPLQHVVFEVRFTVEDMAQLPEALRERLGAILKYCRGVRSGHGADHAAEALGVVLQAVRCLQCDEEDGVS